MVTGRALNGWASCLAIHTGDLGFPVTVHTPPHREIRNLSQVIHALYRTMAALARDAGTQMSSVIEARIGGKIMDFYPGNRFWGFLGIPLQIAVKPQGVVELFQFVRNDGLGRPIRFTSLQDFRDHFFLRGRDEAMAAHANAGRRDTSVATFLRPIMTIETGDLLFTYMEPMGESNGLLGLVPLLVTR